MVCSVTIELVVLHDIRKQTEEATGSKPVSSNPPQILIQFLPQIPVVIFLNDKSVTRPESCQLTKKKNLSSPSYFWSKYFFITAAETQLKQSVLFFTLCIQVFNTLLCNLFSFQLSKSACGLTPSQLFVTSLLDTISTKIQILVFIFSFFMNSHYSKYQNEYY